MHVCVIAPNRFRHDKRNLALVETLTMAGHRVSVVAVDNTAPAEPVTATVRSSLVTGTGPLGTVVRRLTPRNARKGLVTRRLASAAAATEASIFVPTHQDAVEAAEIAARAVGGVVHRTPEQTSSPSTDLIMLAPANHSLTQGRSDAPAFHTLEDRRQPYHPEPERHRGKKIVICYRKTDSNPGKYLEEALRWSGLSVRVETDRIDLATVDADAQAVVFVEGPYPALEVSGNTEVPVLFWAHHGEHHVYTNIRLADRYQADTVLLAHSWHLAYWFPAPVHRFPFGVAMRLLDPSLRLSERSHDVALVGAKLREGGPYGRRQQIVAELSAAFPPQRLGLGEKVTSSVMASLYANARIVVNEGGTRHYPITMRVLEAVGSGAVLLSDNLPGTEMILEPGVDFAILTDDVVSDARALLADPERMQGMADSALDRATGINTYDHRVDELIEIARLTRKRPVPEPRVRTPLGRAVDRDVEVQRLVHIGAPDLAAQLPTREVWALSEIPEHRIRPGNIEAVALRDTTVREAGALLEAARRYVYVDGQVPGLEDWMSRSHPQAIATREGDVTRYDLLAEAYRMMPHEVIG